MYNVKEVEALNIKQRWQQNETFKTMSVPLGVRGKDDILSLNLHEKHMVLMVSSQEQPVQGNQKLFNPISYH